MSKKRVHEHDDAHENQKQDSTRAMDLTQKERDHCGYPKDSKHYLEHYHTRGGEVGKGILGRPD
jgi:hypothetical protein